MTPNVQHDNNTVYAANLPAVIGVVIQDRPTKDSFMPMGHGLILMVAYNANGTPKRATLVNNALRVYRVWDAEQLTVINNRWSNSEDDLSDLREYIDAMEHAAVNTDNHYYSEDAVWYAQKAATLKAFYAQLTQPAAPVVEAAPQRPAQDPVTYAEIIARGNAVTTPVANPTHGKAATVCGTCGGAGQCMDCDTLMVTDARIEIANLKERRKSVERQPRTPITKTRKLAQIDALIADLEAYIARKSPQPAPVCPNCDGKGERDYSVAKGYEDINPCHVCQPALEATAQDDDTMRSDDILAQLSYINSHNHGYAAQQIAHKAADTIRALRAQLDGVLADLGECERGRTATTEAFAGQSAAYEAEIATLKEAQVPRIEIKPVTDPQTNEVREYLYVISVPMYIIFWSGYERREEWAKEAAQKALNSPEFADALSKTR